jgi:hypothetical protein
LTLADIAANIGNWSLDGANYRTTVDTNTYIQNIGNLTYYYNVTTIGAMNTTINAQATSISTLAANNASMNATYGPYGLSISTLAANNASLNTTINLIMSNFSNYWNTTTIGIMNTTLITLVNNNASLNTSKANIGNTSFCTYGIANFTIKNNGAPDVVCAAQQAGGTLGAAENTTINALVENNKSMNATYGLYAASITALAANNASHNTTYGAYTSSISTLAANNASMNATYGPYGLSISTLAANNASLNTTINLIMSNFSNYRNSSADNTYVAALGNMTYYYNVTTIGAMNTTINTLVNNNVTHNLTIIALVNANISLNATVTALVANNQTHNTSITALIANNQSLNTTMTSWRSSSVGFTNTTGNITTDRNVSFSVGITLTTSGTQPACSAAYRGNMWMNFSAAGTTDFLFACGKNSTDSYGWALIARWD